MLMSINDAVFALGDLIESTFFLLESSGNKMNVLIIIVGSIACAMWIKQMAKYDQEAKEKGTLQ
jgi:hypothetical protein